MWRGNSEAGHDYLAVAAIGAPVGEEEEGAATELQQLVNDEISHHEHTAIEMSDSDSSDSEEEGEVDDEDESGEESDGEEGGGEGEGEEEQSNVRDPASYTREERRFLSAANGIRSSYSLFIAYLIPSAIVLSLGIVLDWGESCDAPMQVWALLQVALQAANVVVKLITLWYLGRYSVITNEFDVRAARASVAFKMLNLVNSTLHLAWAGWFTAGLIWTAQVLFGARECDAQSLIRISVILMVVQVFVVVMFLVLCLLACCAAGIYIGLYYRSLAAHAYRAGASAELIERCTKTELFTEEFAEPDSCCCAICLEDYEEGELLRILGCSELHHFHAECVDQWLKKNKTCPLCKRSIDEGEEGEEAEEEEDAIDSDCDATEERRLLAEDPDSAGSPAAEVEQVV